MSFYLDTNVVVPFFRPDPATAAVERWFSGAKASVAISDFGAVEFAAVLSRDVRANAISATQAKASLDKFDIWREQGARYIAVGSNDIQQAEQLVCDFRSKLRAPDALHLAVATNAGLTLVTLDQRLADAAAMTGAGVVMPK